MGSTELVQRPPPSLAQVFAEDYGYELGYPEQCIALSSSADCQLQYISSVSAGWVHQK